MRRDIFEMEESENEWTVSTDCLRQSDLDTIFNENHDKEASIQEEYHMLLQLRTDLAKRLAALKAHPIKTHDNASDVYVPLDEYKNWILGSEMIQKIVKTFDTNPMIMSPPILHQMTEAEMKAQQQLNHTDAEYIDIDQPDTIQYNTDSLVSSILEILKKNMNERIRVKEANEAEDSVDVNACVHGKLDPICVSLFMS